MVCRMDRWVNVDEIKDNHYTYVVQRGHGLAHKAFRWYGVGNYKVMDVPDIRISATEIRNMLKHGKSVKYLVHNEALNRIEYNYGTTKT